MSNYHPCAKKGLCCFILYWLVVAQLSILTYCREDWIASGWPIFSNKVGTGTALPSPSEDAQTFSGGEQLKQYYDVLRVPMFFLFWKYSVLYLKGLEK